MLARLIHQDGGQEEIFSCPQLGATEKYLQLATSLFILLLPVNS